MSQGSTHELQAQSQELLRGPLKHARTAAQALALVPLAAVAAKAQAPDTSSCGSGGICGTVFYDANGNGIQDSGEGGIGGASVTITYTQLGNEISVTVPTDGNGFYFWGGPSGTDYTISVQIPNGLTASPPNQGTDDLVDSDGISDGNGNSVAHLTLPADDFNGDSSTDFGFTNSGFTNPGTGTPGYWKNHPEAWPVSTITVGNQTYTVQQAIDIMGTPVTKDKTYTMFASLVSAMLNVQVGNDSTCVSDAIAAGQQWMTTYGPAGHGVAASSYAWKTGEPFHRLMDNYNNGMLCAPHRD